MRRKGETGSTNKTGCYKVRRISTGLYFKPEYRNPIWNETGRAYPTLNGALTAADNATERQPNNSIHAGGTTLVPRNDLEVVEFELREVQTHAVRA